MSKLHQWWQSDGHILYCWAVDDHHLIGRQELLHLKVYIIDGLWWHQSFWHPIWFSWQLIHSTNSYKFKRSCETQILTPFLASALDNKIQTNMVILDFSKAFDLVLHQRLLNKAHHYGIRGCTFQWMTSFLNSRTQQVIVEGQSSEKVSVVSGVPQGSVLGPVLFLIIINDLPDDLSSKTRMFADDCIVYREIKSPQKEEEKTSTYLCVDFQSNLACNQHVNRVTKKANSMLGFLHASEEAKTQSLISMVRPNLDYWCTIWISHHQDQKYRVEMVQRRVARFVTNRYRTTSSVTDMLDYLGREKHEARRTKLQLNVFTKSSTIW